MKPVYFAFFLFLLPNLAAAQGVQNASYTTSKGERVLRLECVISTNKHEAWKLLATAEGWKKWAAPIVSFDFKVGGVILTNYDTTKTVNDPGTIRLPIINYLEGELLTLRVILTKGFAQKVREEDENLQEIIQLVDLGNGTTKIISSMVGWGNGSEWDNTYSFFEKGNAWAYQQLLNLFPLSK